MWNTEAGVDVLLDAQITLGISESCKLQSASEIWRQPVLAEHTVPSAHRKHLTAVAPFPVGRLV